MMSTSEDINPWSSAAASVCSFFVLGTMIGYAVRTNNLIGAVVALTLFALALRVFWGIFQNRSIRENVAVAAGSSIAWGIGCWIAS